LGLLSVPVLVPVNRNITAAGLVLGLWAAVGDVQHCLPFTWWSYVSCCKAPLSTASNVSTAQV